MTLQFQTYGIVGGSPLPEMAADLNYISNLIAPNVFTTPYLQTGSLDGTSGFVTAISLTGRFSFSALQILNNLSEVFDIRLTIDGDLKWDSSHNFLDETNILGAIGVAINNATMSYTEPYLVKETLLLEVQSATDTAFNFNFVARPIL